MTRKEILSAYIEAAKRKRSYPSLDEMNAEGITRAMIRVHYANLNDLKADAMNSLQDVILDVENFTSKHIKQSIKKLQEYKRFVITSVVTNSDINKEYFNSIKTYCKKENACLIIIPTLNRVKGMSKYTLDPILKDEVIVFYDYQLNSNIKILGMQTNAKATEPTTGLPRLGKRNGSVIVGSPKQNLKIVPTGINSLPHALMSTGAITHPEYVKGSMMYAKNDMLADNDHVMGCLIVEVDGDMFHFRQTQADVKGGFTDLGSYYKDSKKKSLAPAGMVLGDLHSGEICEATLAGIFNLTDAIKVPEYIIHDGVSLNSVSHHNEGKNITKARLARDGRLSLDVELQEYYCDLKRLRKHVDRVTIVKSNHDEFLTGYLNDGRYVYDPHNHQLSLMLALAMLNSVNPIEHFIHDMEGLSRKGFTWLKEDAHYTLGPVLVSQHGHRGQNGKKGISPKGAQESFGNCITGHSHTPAIVGSSMVVGTTSKLQLDYNKGASSWLNTSALVYENGVKQLINFFNGKYSTRKL